jgi:hypothetical protein
VIISKIHENSTYVKVGSCVLGVGALEVVVPQPGDSKRHLLELGHKEVVLVQKQNHGSGGKELAVANLVKELDGLVDAVGLAVFVWRIESAK